MSTLKLTVLSTVFMTILLLPGCSGESSDWKKAQESGTIEGYTEFISNYPESKHIQEACIKSEALFLKTNHFFFEPTTYFSLNERIDDVKILNKPAMDTITIKDSDHFRLLILDLKFVFQPDNTIANENDIGYKSRRVIANHIQLKPIDNALENRDQSIPALAYNSGGAGNPESWILMDGKLMHILFLKANLDNQNIRFYEFLFPIPKDLERFSLYYGDQIVKRDVFLKRKGIDINVPVHTTVVQEFKIEKFQKPVEITKPPEKIKRNSPKPASTGKDRGLVTGLINNPKPGPIRLPTGHKPVILQRVPPQYPEEARKNRIQGRVILQIEVNISGKVDHIKVLGGPQSLIPAAIEAVKQWEYKPYNRNGQACPFITTLHIDFRLR